MGAYSFNLCPLRGVPLRRFLSNLTPKARDKVHLVLKKPYFEAIKTGSKVWEFRAESKWGKKIRKSSHVMFQLGSSVELVATTDVVHSILSPASIVFRILGYTKETLGPTSILEKRLLNTDQARALGCPAEMFDADETIIALRIAPFQSQD